MEKNKEPKKKFNLFGKIVLTLLIILILIIGGTFLFINNKLSKIQRIDLDEKDLNVSSDVEKNLSEYRNM